MIDHFDDDLHLSSYHRIDLCSERPFNRFWLNRRTSISSDTIPVIGGGLSLVSISTIGPSIAVRLSCNCTMPCCSVSIVCVRISVTLSRPAAAVGPPTILSYVIRRLHRGHDDLRIALRRLGAGGYTERLSDEIGVVEALLGPADLGFLEEVL